MANIFQFKATNKVKNTLGLGFANVAAGDEFYLTDIQLKRSSVRNAIELGYIEPMGEMDIASAASAIAGTGSEAWYTYLDGITSFRKNTMPALAARIVPPLAAGAIVNTQGADLCGGYVFGRKVAVTGLEVRFSTAPLTAAIQVPRLLVTAGIPTAMTQTLLTSYKNSTGVYYSQTQASIHEHITAATVWAADDLLIIGYSEKFASVVCNMTTESSATTSSTPYYWDGTAWVAFTDSTDYTNDGVAGTYTKTFSRVGDTDNARIVWWEKPDAWVAGGPSGSGAASTDYCVAIKFSGALTALAGGSVYPVVDTPIADINLGVYGLPYLEGGVGNPTVIQKLAAAYLDKTGVTTAWANDGFTTTDYLWIGSEKPFQGFAVDVDTVNDTVSAPVVTYWNGISWVACPTITDGTNAVADTFKTDGTITMATIPTDWTPSAATSISITNGGSGTSTPTTVTDNELYWLRLTTTAQFTNPSTCFIAYLVPALNYWHYIEPKHMTFIDSDEEVHIWVVDENTTIAALSVNAMLADI